MSMLPPAGWYEDPGGSGQLRYWDGVAWTAHYAPRPGTGAWPGAAYGTQLASGPGSGRLPDVGAMLEHAFRLLWARRAPVAAFVAIGAVSSVASFWLIGSALDGVVYRDGAGWSGANSAMVWTIVAAIVIQIAGYLVQSLGVGHQILWARLGEPPPIARTLRAVLRGAPLFVGWTLVLMLAVAVALFVMIVIPSGLGLLLLLPAIPAAIWAWVKVQFLAVAVVDGRPGTEALRNSAAVSRTRWWPTLGRVLLLMLITVAISIAASMFGSLVDRSNPDIEASFVVENDRLIYLDLGEVIAAAGYRPGIAPLLGAVLYGLTGLIMVAGLAVMYAEVHGRPRR